LHAFIGTTGQARIEGTGYDLEKVKNMLINWMRARRDWVEFKTPLEMGRPLNADLSTHIFLFKLVAIYMGFQAEWKMTKDLFVG